MENNGRRRTSDDGNSTANGQTNDGPYQTRKPDTWGSLFRRDKNGVLAEEPWTNGKEPRWLDYGEAEWTRDDAPWVIDRKRGGMYDFLLFAWLYYK